jgi:N-carbamoyl-L-amino-acid hydrolase
MIEAHPNSRNTVPGECFLTVEFRHPEAHVLDSMDAALRTTVEQVAGKANLVARLNQIFDYPPVPFASDCIDAVREAAHKLDLPHADIVSGAGHDACYLSRVAPTGMIFIPCVDGLSHNENEAITQAWSSAGANVLLHAVMHSAIANA